MAVFYETENFSVDAFERPHVCRTDGGHAIIFPKIPVESRWDLEPKRAIELMKLSMVLGEAMMTALNRQGIPVERMNIQDNGNWAIGTERGPRFHLHFYGRARDSVHQKRGEALSFPDQATKFWEGLEPLNEDDVAAISNEIKAINKRRESTDKMWGLP